MITPSLSSTTSQADLMQKIRYGPAAGSPLITTTSSRARATATIKSLAYQRHLIPGQLIQHRDEQVG